MIAACHVKFCHNHTFYHHTEITDFFPPELEGIPGQSMEMPYHLLHCRVPFINISITSFQNKSHTAPFAMRQLEAWCLVHENED